VELYLLRKLGVCARQEYWGKCAVDIVPDFVHVLYDGRIVKSGTKELALELEEKGYDWLKEETREKEVSTI